MSLPPEDDEDLSFMAAMLDFKVVSSVFMAFSMFMTSARVGSDMVAGLGAEAVGDGGEVASAAVVGGLERVGEDRRDRDTRLSRAVTPKIAGPRLRSS